MKIVLHKGGHEISGTCIQLTAGKTSILQDAGLPLSAESKPVDVAQLTVDAALISHSHQDHYGLMTRLPKQTPVYIGKLGKSFIDAAKIFIGEEIQEREYCHFQAWQPFAIGDFTITPYLVDHSAADAYAFLIESEGKRLFYSGDLRSHGQKGILFENLVKRPIRDLNLLFLEGTILHRSNDQFPSEESVEDKIFETSHPVSTSIAHHSNSLSGQSIREQIRIPANPPKTRTEFISALEAWIAPEGKFSAVVLPSMAASGNAEGRIMCRCAIVTGCKAGSS